ncbi:CHAT domain-containing protein [Streptomyces sp. NPDC058475]|uniref:CHAT domain-containing protein n=1 Tax=Streptomyces sp. NPDC058475 TaxID=3346518 RepID=UPI003646C204
MTELQNRVVARLVAAQNAQDPEPLRGQDAVGDAMALLREVAPSPEEEIDLGAVAAVCWTFWLRHLGPEDPDAPQNLFIAVGTCGFLCPRVPGDVPLPAPLRDAFDPADPAHDARFSLVVSAVHADAALSPPDLAEADRLTMLEHALAWSDSALHELPEEHWQFGELAAHARGLNVSRFQLAADPDALAAAARYASAVCERLSSVGQGALGPEMAEVAAVNLGTVVDAARLLGEPELTEVERLVAAFPDGTLAPEAVAGLRLLRAAHAEPAEWPGQRDLQFGTVIADAGIREHDAGRIACAVRRLRTALAHTPAERPEHTLVIAVLGQALEALARERGDDEASRAAAELLGPIDMATVLSDADRQLLADFRDLTELLESGDPHLGQKAGPLYSRFRERVEDRTGQLGVPSLLEGIEFEIVDLGIALALERDAVSDERIDRYRSALAALPAERPLRYAYVAVLAALTGLHAGALRETEPARAELLAAEARKLTDEVAAAAPPRFLALGLLRRGRFDAALPIALSALSSDQPDDTMDGMEGMEGMEGEGMEGKVAKLVSLLSDLDGLRLEDDEHSASDIATLRKLLADVGDDDPSARAPLAAALGCALLLRAVRHNEGAALDEAVPLLRYARSHGQDLPPSFDRVVAFALTSWSSGNLDAEAAREAAALLASSAADDTPGDFSAEMMSAYAGFFNSLQNYMFGHEPEQIERARELAQRLDDLVGEAAARAGNDLPKTDVTGDALLNLVDSLGPGGGPRPDITDDQLDRCRSTFAASPAGDPIRLFTASTLMRMLAQRAFALRDADPETAARLVAEARDVFRAVEGEAPEHWRDTMRMFLDLVGHGDLPPISPPPEASPQVTGHGDLPPISPPPEASPQVTGHGALPPISPPPEASPQAPGHGDLPPISPPPDASPQAPVNALEAVLTSLRARLSGADPAALGNPALPTWFRAHGEIAEAAGALGSDQPDIDRALSHLEAAIDAMADITDRGSDQQSAEHGLTTFEGDIRTITELVLIQGLRLRAAVGMHAFTRHVTAALDDIKTALGEQREPDAGALVGLPEPEALRRVLLYGPVAGPDVDRATELLERGRGLLLSRRIEARADLSDLRSAHPDLAAEFERLTDLLAAEVEVPEPTVPAGHAEWSRLTGFRASKDLDQLVERIRTRPGFDGFLRPLTAGQLRSLAADGPIVVLNHAQRYCYALVVTEESIAGLRLDAESDEITDAALRLRDAVDAINAHGPSRPSPADLVAAGATVRETLAWTWHKIVRPVLDLVGAGDPVPDEGTWPRIWWVPTGAFNALPLHAAQCTLPECELDGCGAALDAVVSSYVPGFQTLAYARTRAEHRDTADHGRAVLVAAPDDELPGIAAAAGYAAGLLGAREPLIGAAATREAVLAALGGAPWVHFGCHATTDRTEPSGALLHLPSGEALSVLEICRARPQSAQLAFLAACGTARTAERLSDEAVHITSAFLLAGFPAAVGTLWEIDSTHADHVTRDFYRRLVGDGTDTSPHALHHTVRELRRRMPDRPHIWAAYVHAGT